jgi:hypothetical protein
VPSVPVKIKPSSTLFERRTLTVLAALVLSMTLVSTLLLVLEPTPLGPIGGPVLTVVDPTPRGLDAVFNPIEKSRQWQAIIVHHSGTTRGNVRTLTEQHQDAGYAGLGYHFVIGNGDGAEDGEVQVGYRWKQQLDGLYRDAISICVIGDGDRSPPTPDQMEQLVRLTTALQHRLGIPAERVVLHTAIAQDTTSPGRLFPASAFRQQLLMVDAR